MSYDEVQLGLKRIFFKLTTTRTNKTLDDNSADDLQQNLSNMLSEIQAKYAAGLAAGQKS